MKRFYLGAALILSAWIAGYAASEGAAGQRTDNATPRAQDIRGVEPKRAELLYRVMMPLLRAMDPPKSPEDVSIGVIEDKAINAANAGGGKFYVTTGLLERADEGQLRGIMAHEIGHDDLGHVAQLQILGGRPQPRRYSPRAINTRKQFRNTDCRQFNRARLQPVGGVSSRQTCRTNPAPRRLPEAGDDRRPRLGGASIQIRWRWFPIHTPGHRRKNRGPEETSIRYPIGAGGTQD